MGNHIFSRWQVTLCTLFLLADGLYLPLHQGGWLALLGGAAVSAILLFPLLKLPKTLLDGICGVLAILLPLRTLLRLFQFWQYTGMRAALTAALFLVTAWLLSRHGADCLFMWSYPVMLTAGILLLLSVAVTLPDWDLGIPALSGNFLRECAGTVPGFLTVLLPAHLAGDAKAPAKGLLLGGGLLALLSLRTLMLLGGASYAYPTYSAAGLAAMGDFLRRCEVVFAAILVLCECARTAVCFSFLRSFGKPRGAQNPQNKMAKKAR